jgi:hypothetical protein
LPGSTIAGLLSWLPGSTVAGLLSWLPGNTIAGLLTWLPCPRLELDRFFEWMFVYQVDLCTHRSRPPVCGGAPTVRSRQNKRHLYPVITAPIWHARDNTIRTSALLPWLTADVRHEWSAYQSSCGRRTEQTTTAVVVMRTMC